MQFLVGGMLQSSNNISSITSLKAQNYQVLLTLSEECVNLFEVVVQGGVVLNYCTAPEYMREAEY